VSGTLPAANETDGSILENQFARFVVDRKTGNLSSIFEKKTDHELLGEYTTTSRVIPEMPAARREPFEQSTLIPESAGIQGNILQLHGDYPKDFDAWEIGLTGRLDEMSTVTKISPMQSGAVYSEITVSRAYGKSTIQQTYRLYRALPYLEVLNAIDWHERHVMLKAAFPLSVTNKWANYEIPFAAINRPAIRTAPEEIGKYEHSGIQWGNMDDASGAAGLAILTMDKYGFDAKDNVLRLSLLRGPDSPNINADRFQPKTDEGFHSFSYAVYPHPGTWQSADVVRQGYEFNHTPVPLTGLNPSAGSESFLQVQPSNVIVASVKKAEDDNSLILRVYEAEGAEKTTARITLPWKPKTVNSADLMENTDSDVAKQQDSAAVNGREIQFPLGKFQIATYKITF
jgi:alpha-mannosidase